jgi:hypothetical protein
LVPSVRTPVSDSVQIDQEAARGAIWDVLAAAVGGSSRVASAQRRRP